MQLGYLTPPVGLNLFIASYRFKKPILDVYKATFPFLVILFKTVIIITFLPSLSLVLLPDKLFFLRYSVINRRVLS